jgi:hypothetical protein
MPADFSEFNAVHETQKYEAEEEKKHGEPVAHLEN